MAALLRNLVPNVQVVPDVPIVELDFKQHIPGEGSFSFNYLNGWNDWNVWN